MDADEIRRLRRAIEIVENMCWPLSAVGFGETAEVSEGILRVYFDFLSTASKRARLRVAAFSRTPRCCRTPCGTGGWDCAPATIASKHASASAIWSA